MLAGPSHLTSLSLIELLDTEKSLKRQVRLFSRPLSVACSLIHRVPLLEGLKMAAFGEFATAVGVVAAGIQICQTLAQYYGDSKDFHEDVKGTCNDIDRLGRILSAIEEAITKGKDTLDSSDHKQVLEYLISCQGAIEKLNKKVKKISPCVAPKSLKDGVRSHLNRSFYPFRESTLATLREIVSDLI